MDHFSPERAEPKVYSAGGDVDPAERQVGSLPDLDAEIVGTNENQPYFGKEVGSGDQAVLQMPL